MRIELEPLEVRVLGCLIEKEITTPEQYPLSLNALTAACNQKSNRDPVLELTDSQVQAVVDGLMRRHLVSDRSGYGSRTVKYKHRFCNTEFGALKLSAQETGVLCVLMLRGPQTPGELRGRTQRMCEFADTAEVERAIEFLMTRTDGPYVARLARAPGAREHRYAHLFCGAIESVDATVPEPGVPGGESLTARVARLETLVEQLQMQLEALRAERAEASAPDSSQVQH